MTILQAAFLGLLQAVTEILPFSHTTHLVLFERFFHFKYTYGVYEIVTEVGTLTALLIFFSRDVLQMVKESPALVQFFFVKNKPAFFSGCQYALTLSLILMACVATVLGHFLLSDIGAQMSRINLIVGAVWTLMGALIFLSRKIPAGGRSAYEMNHQDSFVLGLAQGLTVFLGISRSGITTVVGMKMGIERSEAARFSFLLGIPYMIFTLAVKLLSRPAFFEANQIALGVCFLVSLFASLFMIALTMRLIEKGRYFLLGLYCIAAGITAFAYATVQAYLY